MSLLDSKRATTKPRSKTVFRNTTCCLKLTKEEAQLLDEIATARGVAAQRMDARGDLARAAFEARRPIRRLRRFLAFDCCWSTCFARLPQVRELSPEFFDKLLDEISTAKHDLADRVATERKR